ncbi:MAG: phosphoenolpyruvate carboxylase [Arhodomonas sp.]|nr:phosphoenolpyruvate carboxylase [Arhodomonas sp.]
MDEKRTDAPLREDIRQLGGLLGSTLHDQWRSSSTTLVEEVRRLAKDARAGRRGAAAGARDATSRARTDGIIMPVVRAFSQFLNLANIAEQHHRVRRSRAWRRDPQAAPLRGSLEEAFERLR